MKLLPHPSSFFITKILLSLSFIIGSLPNQATGYKQEEVRFNCEVPSNLSITNDDIIIPQSAGEYIENCHENPNYNACIYRYSSFIQNGSLTPEFRDIFETAISLDEALAEDIPFIEKIPLYEDSRYNQERFNEAMRSHQTYAVNITGTTDRFLRNEHYDVILTEISLNPFEYLFSTIRVRQHSHGKWTTPYFSSNEYKNDSAELIERHGSVYPHNVAQVMAYYHLMYQKEWMELNTGRWYALRRNISVDLTDAVGGGWSFSENKITYGFLRSIFQFNSMVPEFFNTFTLLHEAAHANFYYSNLSREGSTDETQRECEDTDCCVTKDGCLRAINEGQSDFNAFIPYPDFPIAFFIEELVHREALMERNEEIQSFFLDDSGQCSHVSRDHRANQNLKAEEAFSCDRGAVHSMGALYASIWWEIYNHKDTSKRDIATLFTEHLPLVSNDDTFRTVASKIINKARELFNGPKGEHYACMISQEFTWRGLTPLTLTAE